MKRLLGIDLCRGIAAYAVILVHSGDATWGLPISSAAENFRLLFYFAVPFFIATSFYLMVNRPKIEISGRFWRSRIERIVIPYIAWTIIYLSLKLVLFPLSDRGEQIAVIFQDPWGIVFLGGASYHLYFLPLIFTGSFLVVVANYLNKKHISLPYLLFLLGLSLIGYQIAIWSDNNFQLGANVAFVSILQLINPDFPGYNLVRLILVAIAWLLRCLPYLLASIIYANLIKNQRLRFPGRTAILFWLATFIIVNTSGTMLPLAFREIAISFSLLSLAISLSNYLNNSQFIINLGKCSFGIYLLHPLIKSGVEVFLHKFIPTIVQSISITSMIVYSGLTFVMSWYVVSLGIKNKAIAKYLFGL